MRSQDCSPLTVLDFQQDVAQRLCKSSARDFLPTITCSSGYLYIHGRDRFCTPDELLVAHGYPGFGALGSLLGVVCPNLSMLRRSVKVRLAGEGVHLACIGCVLLWIVQFLCLPSASSPRSSHSSSFSSRWVEPLHPFISQWYGVVIRSPTSLGSTLASPAVPARSRRDLFLFLRLDLHVMRRLCPPLICASEML